MLSVQSPSDLRTVMINKTCFPTTITLPTTGEILQFEHADMDMHQGIVGVYGGFTASTTRVAFEPSLAWHFFASPPLFG